MATDLLHVSRKLPPLLEAKTVGAAWRALSSTPVDALPTSRRALAELRADVRGTPPSYDPTAVLGWATGTLWSLSVYTLPEDCCDEDQGDLELWHQASSGSIVLVCQLGGAFAFRDRFPSDDAPLQRWSGDPHTLLPATRSEVLGVLENADL